MDKKIIKRIIITFLIITIIAISILVYARYVGTKNIKVNEIKLVENIPDEFKGFKIVHISDIQYGKTTFTQELNELKDKINLTKPDIVVLTGDLINKETNLTEDDKKILIEFLNSINAKINKYFITGDNDVLFSEFNVIMKNGGFTNLDNSYDKIYNGSLNYIMIYGMGNDSNVNLEVNEENIYKILITHKPDMIDSVVDNFNLVLAGHSLNGLVNLPLIGPLFLEDGAKKYNKDFYLINNTKLYISNGIGTNNYSYRLFNRPSFNFYRITNKQ